MGLACGHRVPPQIVYGQSRGKELTGAQPALVVFDVAFIVFPQALPRGCVEDEGRGLQHDGDADVQVSVGHVVVQDAGALLPAECAPEQAGGVDAGPKDEGRGDEACEGGKNTSCSPPGSAGWPPRSPLPTGPRGWCAPPCPTGWLNGTGLQRLEYESRLCPNLRKVFKPPVP